MAHLHREEHQLPILSLLHTGGSRDLPCTGHSPSLQVTGAGPGPQAPLHTLHSTLPLPHWLPPQPEVLSTICSALQPWTCHSRWVGVNGDTAGYDITPLTNKIISYEGGGLTMNDTLKYAGTCMHNGDTSNWLIVVFVFCLPLTVA